MSESKKIKMKNILVKIWCRIWSIRKKCRFCGYTITEWGYGVGMCDCCLYIFGREMIKPLMKSFDYSSMGRKN